MSFRVGISPADYCLAVKGEYDLLFVYNQCRYIKDTDDADNVSNIAYTVSENIDNVPDITYTFNDKQTTFLTKYTP